MALKKSPLKTSKPDPLENDLQPINEFKSVKDCLGKYKPDTPRPRPILIKFLCSTEASMALSKIASFKAPVYIKQDLTNEERQVLLQERWTLMQQGFDKKRIKLPLLTTSSTARTKILNYVVPITTLHFLQAIHHPIILQCNFCTQSMTT